MEVSKCWKIVEFSKVSIKEKTFYETQTASHLQETIQPSPNTPPSDKMLLCLSKKKLYAEIYRHLLSQYFKNAVLERQEMV